METQQDQPVIAHYIEHRHTASGDRKAYIVGTRLAVENIYICHELQGMTPDQIVSAYPQLSLAQVHAALAYFFDHPNEVRDQVKRSEEFSRQSESAQGATKFSRLRDAVLGTKDGGNRDSSTS